MTEALKQFAIVDLTSLQSVTNEYNKLNDTILGKMKSHAFAFPEYLTI